MSILITGGLGYIGKNVVKLIHDRSEEHIVIIDNLSNSYTYNIDLLNTHLQSKRIAIKIADLCNYNQLESIVSEFDIKEIIHFAALKSVKESEAEPLLYYENNLLSTINLLKICRTYKIEKFIFSSSCSVYGNINTQPIFESSATSPISVYGKTKLMCEKLIEESLKVLNTKFVSLRYFNPVGASQDYIFGEHSLSNEKTLFTAISDVLIEKQKYLEIYGDDYDTPDGTCIRDFVHVIDIADGHLMAMDYDQKNQLEVFNLGSGKGYSVLEIIKSFDNELGREIPFQFSSRRKGDVEIITADITLAKNKLNWTPKYKLKDMVKSTVNWIEILPKYISSI